MASRSYPCLKSRSTQADRTDMIVYLSSRPRNDRRWIEIGRRQTASLVIFQLSEKREMREKMELVIRNATIFSIRTWPKCSISKEKGQRDRSKLRINVRCEHIERAERAYWSSKTSKDTSKLQNEREHVVHLLLISRPRAEWCQDLKGRRVDVLIIMIYDRGRKSELETMQDRIYSLKKDTLSRETLKAN